jgi:hypothetical protein
VSIHVNGSIDSSLDRSQFCSALRHGLFSGAKDLTAHHGEVLLTLPKSGPELQAGNHRLSYPAHHLALDQALYATCQPIP